MKVAVVGHVEWIRFARVEHAPAPGEIVHSTEEWEQAGGGGGVAAIQLALLADEAHLFTVLGDDQLGRASRTELEEHGVHVQRGRGSAAAALGVHAGGRGGRADDHDRRAEAAAERGDDRLPWHELDEMDAVLFITGDVEALRHARRARVLTATARDLENLRRGAVELDALIGSGEDEAERYHAGDLDPEPKLVVTTSGALGGWMQPGGPFVAAPVPGPREDAYGCGDSFMAGLTFALGSKLEAHDAVGFAARCGAAALTGRGVAPQPVAL